MCEWKLLKWEAKSIWDLAHAGNQVLDVEEKSSFIFMVKGHNLKCKLDNVWKCDQHCIIFCIFFASLTLKNLYVTSYPMF